MQNNRKIIKQSIEIDNKSGDKIYADFRYPAAEGKLPLVVMLHGFLAWKNWGFFPYAAECIADAGSIVINFSNSHCGVPADYDEFLEPEKFADYTISGEIADTLRVIDAFIEGVFSLDSGTVWSGEIYLVGHSRGGSVALLVAGEDKRISKVVSWSGIDRFVRYPERQIEKFRDIGYFEFEHTPTGAILRINRIYLDDYEKNIERYAPVKCVPRLEIPLLFVHGKQDLTVPYRESEGLYKLAKNKNSQLHLVENAGHTFGISHPFKQTTKAFEEVLSTTISFLGL